MLQGCGWFVNTEHAVIYLPTLRCFYARFAKFDVDRSTLLGTETQFQRFWFRSGKRKIVWQC